MCFSATGSFGVAALLTGIGVVSLKQDKAPSHRLLAVVPLLFAAQQVAEGFVWKTIDNPSQGGAQVVAVFLFLCFALLVWPTWVPFALLRAETNPRRRQVLSALACVGVGVAMYAGYILIHGRPTAHVVGHSIVYSYVQIGPPRVVALYLPLYVIPAVLPFFVSTLSTAKIMGSVLAVALVATLIIERAALISVWCFFAAILSGVIVLAIAAEHRLKTKLGATLP
jgi:hypothetical protein